MRQTLWYNDSMNNTAIEIFEIGIERLNGPSYYVYYREPTIHFQKSGINSLFSTPTDKIISKPSWSDFFETMEPFQIWSLKKEYGSTLLAKLWWHLNIKSATQEVVSCGINLFPDQKNESDSLFFKALKTSINKLVGEIVF